MSLTKCIVTLFSDNIKVKVVLTVWVVAVNIPSLTFVQSVSVVNDADSTKPTVAASFDDGVANTSSVEPSRRTHMET